MRVLLSLFSRIALVAIVAIDLYIITNVSFYYLKLDLFKSEFKSINSWMSDNPTYFYISFAVLIVLAAISAEPRRIPLTLIFGALGIALFNLFGKAFSTSLFSFF